MKDRIKEWNGDYAKDKRGQKEKKSENAAFEGGTLHI